MLSSVTFQYGVCEKVELKANNYKKVELSVKLTNDMLIRQDRSLGLTALEAKLAS